MKQNIKIIFLFILLVSVNSCIVKKKATNIVVIDENSKNETNNSETLIISSVPIPVLDTVLITDVQGQTSLKLKDEYNIVIILPLFSDSLNSNWRNHEKSDLKDFKIPSKSLKSLSFIEGMMIAFEDELSNSRLNIKVYDNQASLFQTDLILSKIGFESIDIIVGPMNNNNIMSVAAFAKKNDIIMFSPFSHSKINVDYDKFIMTSPSLDSHLKEITYFIKDSLPVSNLKIIYPNSLKGIKYAFSYKDILKRINDSIKNPLKKIRYALVEVEARTKDRSDFDIKDHLDTDILNTVIVLPSSSGFSQNMLTKLNEQRKEFDITVFGMPNWRTSKTARLDYFNNLNVHISDSEWIDKGLVKTELFISNYKLKTEGIPTKEAFKAYDLFRFMVVLLNKYGMSIPENIEKESFKGIYKNYQFKKVTDKLNPNSAEIKRIENSAVHIISYENFKLILKK